MKNEVSIKQDTLNTKLLCEHKNIICVEYRGTPEDYDGVSEVRCKDCNMRWGRWSGKELKDGELEKRYGGR
jgi:hypothetical protein